MPAPSPTWTTRRVYITYRNLLTGLMEPGTWEAVATGRITNTLSDGTRQVFRKGKLAAGSLNTTEGVPSFSTELPVVDDPQNSPQGGEIVLTITFSNGGGSEIFHISPLESWPVGGTDLALLLDPEIVPAAPPFAIKGVPGGVAELDFDGDVVDAEGNKVIASGGGGGGVSSYAEIEALSDYPTVIAAGATQAAARQAIGAGTSNLTLGTTASTAKAGNYAPTWSDVTEKPATFPATAHTHPWTDVTGKPTTFAPSAHTHAASDITSGTFDAARLTPGSVVTLKWNASLNRWEDLLGTAVTARPAGRNDLSLRFVGGAAANIPSWANQDTDEHIIPAA